MPAPKRPNTAAATAAVKRRGQESAAARLREAGWMTLRPEEVAEILASSDSFVVNYIRGLAEDAVQQRG